MSREYYYSPAIRKEDGYYPALYEKDGDKLEPALCYWHYDHLSEEESDILTYNRIPASSLKGEFREHFYLDEDKDENMHYFYVLNEKDVKSHSSSGLKKGYMPLEIVLEANRCQEPLHEYNYELVPSDIYAAMTDEKKKEYVSVAYIDYGSLSRTFSIISQVFWNHYPKDGELCIIAHYSY